MRLRGVLWVGPVGCYRVYKGGVPSSSYDACALLDYDTATPSVGLLHWRVVFGSRRYEVIRTQCLGVARGDRVVRDTGGRVQGQLGPKWAVQVIRPPV